MQPKKRVGWLETPSPAANRLPIATLRQAYWEGGGTLPQTSRQCAACCAHVGSDRGGRGRATSQQRKKKLETGVVFTAKLVWQWDSSGAAAQWRGEKRGDGGGARAGRMGQNWGRGSREERSAVGSLATGSVKPVSAAPQRRASAEDATERGGGTGAGGERGEDAAQTISTTGIPRVKYPPPCLATVQRARARRGCRRDRPGCRNRTRSRYVSNFSRQTPFWAPSPVCGL
jgi:hypothetical protein